LKGGKIRLGSRKGHADSGLAIKLAFGGEKESSWKNKRSRLTLSGVEGTPTGLRKEGRGKYLRIQKGEGGTTGGGEKNNRLTAYRKKGMPLRRKSYVG